MKALLAKLQTIEVNGDKEYAIANLKGLSERTAEISRKLEQYKPIVTQVASFFDLSFSLSPADIGAISTAVQILAEQSPDTLSKRTAELCNPSNQSTLLIAQGTCRKLRSLKEDFEQKYNLSACDTVSQMRCYARTLRSANLLTYLFDSDYKKAWTTWKKIQRKQEKLSDSEIAKRLDQIATFLEEVDAFKKDKQLR